MIRFDIQEFFQEREIRNIKLTKIENYQDKIVIPREYQDNIHSCHYIEIEYDDGGEEYIEKSKLDWDVIEDNKCFGGNIFKLKNCKGYWIYDRPTIREYFQKLENTIAENIRLKNQLYLIK